MTAKHGFLLQHLHEGGAQIEEQASLLIGQLRYRDCRASPGALAPQFALVPPLYQVAAGHEGQSVAKRAIGISGEGIELVGGDREVGIGPQERGDLVGAGFLDADLGGAERGIRRPPVLA